MGSVGNQPSSRCNDAFEKLKDVALIERCDGNPDIEAGELKRCSLLHSGAETISHVQGDERCRRFGHRHACAAHTVTASMNECRFEAVQPYGSWPRAKRELLRRLVVINRGWKQVRLRVASDRLWHSNREGF